MRRRSNGLMIVVVLAWVGLVAAGARGQQPGGNPEAKKLKNPVPATPESIAAGQGVYQKFCRFCHGADAKGDGPMAPEGTHPSNLVDDKWDRGSTDGEIFAVIRDGAGPKFDMKGCAGKLTETDMWNVVNYLRSLVPKAKSH